MQDKKQLVTNWTAGGWSGSIGGLNNAIQQIPEGCQIRDGNYNAGTHYGFSLNSPVSKHRRWVWPYVRKGQRRKSSGNRNVKLPVAHNLWNAIRVYSFRLLLIRHR
jgi:hypothetical protein